MEKTWIMEKGGRYRGCTLGFASRELWKMFDQRNVTLYTVREFNFYARGCSAYFMFIKLLDVAIRRFLFVAV